ncbi:DUF6397 family protein [Streptomyces millisiae]|uniref:DUF6397 family protein n=1 Tax=Streptomyces millisiae TaxID=3075542 RepID=A0ABU2LXX3_9ACTN|nr:DUF6397 family protein [Streptomyces sp. DSM 44918]MDT0322426.1 DUF6397 family protein [Streptomyces sp. DSM 44918]
MATFPLPTPRTHQNPSEAPRGPAAWTAGRAPGPRLVSASDGAALLDVSPSRFARLARGGCFSPAEFRISPLHIVTWWYPAAELRLFAARESRLLGGPIPEGLRRALGRGEDWRPRRWRTRRTAELVRRTTEPWRRAAVFAAVLEPPLLLRRVPEPRERALLRRLRPALADPPPPGFRQRAFQELLTAAAPDEARWYVRGLELALRDARARPPAGPRLRAGRPPGP